MRVFPTFFRTDNAHVIVFGGGEEARRKIRLLAKTTARITIVADQVIDEGLNQEFAGRITVAKRSMTEAVLRRSSFAIIACRQPESRDRAVALARKHGVMINVVDMPELCDFTIPSILERGEIVVSVSSGGTAPVLAKRIRTQLEVLLPRTLASLSRLASTFRPHVRTTLQDSRQRRQFWESALEGQPGKLALNGDQDGARNALKTMLDTFADKNRSPQDRQAECVFIVGAGPGDPELLTLRALRLIQNADIVFHDRLVSDDILDLVRRDAERVPVGKARTDHGVGQQTIHELMVKAARTGRRVVRLKGGDPFIFGRGGEELEALHKASIAVQIVPGISAPQGCAASAGLPLTHRDHAQTLTFVTGHAKSDDMPALDWSGLARPGQTLVIFMGIANAAVIARKLTAAGRTPSTPAAIIENGTRQNERKIFCTLAELPRMACRTRIEGPVLIIIGEVCAIASATLVKHTLKAAA